MRSPDRVYRFADEPALSDFMQDTTARIAAAVVGGMAGAHGYEFEPGDAKMIAAFSADLAEEIADRLDPGPP